MLFNSISILFSKNIELNGSSNIDLKVNKNSHMTLNEISTLKTENILFTRPNFESTQNISSIKSRDNKSLISSPFSLNDSQRSNSIETVTKVTKKECVSEVLKFVGNKKLKK
ncbi:hypothetical protein ACTFIY_007403 [Dictyostelium cf. discoideum]